MLQGIFEPVAERKKTTLNRLLKDFPERKFLLVGDSGEADLEVYTELALANPGRILAVFIRDVTTPQETGFFDSGFNLSKKKSMSFDQNSTSTIKPLSKKKSLTFDQNVSRTSQPSLQRRPSDGPTMGTLIDFSAEPQETKFDRSAALAQVRNSGATRSVSTPDIAGRKAAPPRPAKPVALRSAKSITELNKGVSGLGISREGSPGEDDKPPPMPPRKSIPQIKETPAAHPLSQTQNSSQLGSRKDVSRSGTQIVPPPPPPTRRRGTPSQNSDPAPTLPPRPSQLSSNLDVEYEPLPPPKTPSSFVSSRSGDRSGTRSDGNTPSGSPSLGPQGVNKKVELWRRRLARAHEQLDGLGVALYTWRRGSDVMVEAEAIVKRALRDMDGKRRT
jgi:ATP-dependent RNA helicase DDX27